MDYQNITDEERLELINRELKQMEFAHYRATVLGPTGTPDKPERLQLMIENLRAEKVKLKKGS